MQDWNGIKQKLATANRILVNEELTELGRGHVAYHIGENRILIPGHLHDYQRSIADCTASDIVTIDYEGNVVEGSYPESMHEFYFYSEVFKVRADVKAALHMHAFYTNLLAMANQKIALISRDSFGFTDGVPIYSGLPLFVNTPQMGKQMADLLGKKKAIVHRGHGVFIVGGSIEEVVTTGAALERASRKQYFASCVGQLLQYDPDDIKKHHSLELENELMEADWGYFVTRLEKRGVRV